MWLCYNAATLKRVEVLADRLILEWRLVKTAEAVLSLLIAVRPDLPGAFPTAIAIPPSRSL